MQQRLALANHFLIPTIGANPATLGRLAGSQPNPSGRPWRGAPAFRHHHFLHHAIHLPTAPAGALGRFTAGRFDPLAMVWGVDLRPSIPHKTLPGGPSYICPSLAPPAFLKVMSVLGAAGV